MVLRLEQWFDSWYSLSMRTPPLIPFHNSTFFLDFTYVVCTFFVNYGTFKLVYNEKGWEIMGTGMLSNEEIVEYYRQDAVKLFRYLNWLESKSGKSVSTI